MLYAYKNVPQYRRQDNETTMIGKHSCLYKPTRTGSSDKMQSITTTEMFNTYLNNRMASRKVKSATIHLAIGAVGTKDEVVTEGECQ